MGDGWGVLGVRLRMRGVFTTTNPFSDAPNSLRTETRKKKTEKLGASRKQRIKKRENGFSRRKVP